MTFKLTSLLVPAVPVGFDFVLATVEDVAIHETVKSSRHS